MTKIVTLKKKDFESDQDVRWCPGCGDYAVLATVQKTLAKLGVEKRNQVFVSGIGCSSRFPYYMDTYGFHSIHGRAPAIATGLKVARPDLDVWVITGDGDALSIGGNHLLHVLRRNVNVNILLFNNQIYGLTKGQYSPTSKVGTKAPSTPYGSIDKPVNPIAVALGAGATFVARVADTDAGLMQEVLRRAHEHKGTSFIEILQNCPVFNDAVWGPVTDRKTAKDTQLRLEEGKLLHFGDGKGIAVDSSLSPKIVNDDDKDVIVHKEDGNLAYATVLAHMSHPEYPLPIGIFRAQPSETYDDAVHSQVEKNVADLGEGKLQELLSSGMTWNVE